MRTEDEFLAELKLAVDGKWRVMPDGKIRHQLHYCPGMAVVRTRKDRARFNGVHEDYGNLFMNRMFAAADNSPGYDPALRAKLLRVLGL